MQQINTKFPQMSSSAKAISVSVVVTILVVAAVILPLHFTGTLAKLYNKSSSSKQCEFTADPRNPPGDKGYDDDYRGFYKVDNECCNHFCRWVGGGPGQHDRLQSKDPAKNDKDTLNPTDPNKIFWTCQVGDLQKTPMKRYDSFQYKKCD